MYSLLVAALMALPQPVASPTEPRGSAIAAPATPNVTATPNPTPNPNPTGDRFTGFSRASAGSGFASGIALPASALAALAAVGLLLARRRSRGTRLVQVIETAGLGAKRSLVVARMGPELLLLGVSESGIALLATRSASEQAEVASDTAGAAHEPRGREGSTLSSPGAPPAGRILGLLSRLRAKPPPAQASSFEACLVESTEDQELRRKLARGLAGSVR